MLTDEQRKLVEDNYKLVFYVIRKMKLQDADEWTGVASIGLCNAAKHYDPKKGEFCTFATWCIKNEIIKEIKAKLAQHRDPGYKLASLQSRAYRQSETRSGEEDEIIDFIVDKNQLGWESAIEITEVLEDFLRESRELDRKFFLELMCGKSYLEIAQKYNCTRQNVHFHVKRMRSEIANRLEVQF